MLKWGLVLAIIMMITGSINTISAKFADIQKAVGYDGCRSFQRTFNHPFFQAILMFIGEAFCLVVYRFSVFLAKRKGEVPESADAGFKPYIFIIPAMCDLTATSMLYVGLTLTYASIAQMMRGSVIIFTGILARVFLKQKFARHNILGMFLIVVGLIYVGCSQVLAFDGDTEGTSRSDAPQPMIGAVLIVGAQLIVAVQMIVEQKFISQYSVPALQVVGWEGTWGLTAALIVNFVFYFIKQFPSSVENVMQNYNTSTIINHTDPHCGYEHVKSVVDHLENPIDGIFQMGHSVGLALACLGLIGSIAVFNWSGVSITSYLNATTRMIIDALRTMVVWAFGLTMGWESTNPKRIGFELAGFVLLLMGTFVYKDILIAPALLRLEDWWLTRGSGDREVLIDPAGSSSAQHTSIQRREFLRTSITANSGSIGLDRSLGLNK